MIDEDTYDEGFDPLPPDTEPPEGDLELALQEEAVATEGIAPTAPPPPVVGRTWALDVERGRLLPEGGQPMPIYGAAARRQAIEKCLRTERGSAEIHDDDYGYDGAGGGDEDVQGQGFDSEAFAEMEERVRDALLAIPWVLAVEEFDAQGSPSSPVASVSFRVVPEGDNAEPLDFRDYPLPVPA